MVEIYKAMGRKGFSERADALAALGIDASRYYIGAPDGAVPKEFISGLDGVYISSPNSLHSRQAHDVLSSGTCAIVEKTLATNRQEFDSLLEFAEERNAGGMLYLHLHYLHKQLTLQMEGLLRSAVERYGRAKSVSATFLERYSEDERRRSWLFSMSEGGIFMDWIHPFEVLFYGAMAEEVRLADARSFILDARYSKHEPSGVEALAGIRGRYFAAGAKAVIRVGKGSEATVKRIRFYLDDGIAAEFDFRSSENEFGTEERGVFRIVDESNGASTLIGSFAPRGPDSSQIFASEIAALLRGDNRGMSMAQIARLFEPQWEYQKMLGTNGVVSDSAAVSAFVAAGMRNDPEASGAWRSGD